MFKTFGYGKVVVAVTDSRVQVASGDWTTDQVGQVTSLTGEVYNVKTGSGEPFADDFGAAICNGLNFKGFSCIPLIGPVSDIADQIEAYDPAKTIQVQVRGWRNNIYAISNLDYSFRATVYDRQLNPVATSEIEGNKKLSLAAINPAKSASRAAPKALKEIVEELFDEPSLKAALERR